MSVPLPGAINFLIAKCPALLAAFGAGGSVNFKMGSPWESRQTTVETVPFLKHWYHT